MSRNITINPVTRIEGHAKVRVEVADDDTISAAYMQILEFRGFERFVQGMQVEMMPTLTTRICGTCPHAHHLVASACVDKVFSVKPPRAALLLRELLNAGSMLHSHGIHFFALAGPDLLMGIDAPAEKRNLMGLMEVAPDLAHKALRLRSLGQKICEVVGGKGTHPVTSVGGGVTFSLTDEMRQKLKAYAAESLELCKVALAEGKRALVKNKDLLTIFNIPAHNIATIKDNALDYLHGDLKVRRPDGSEAATFPTEDYKKHLFEEALPYTYGKQVFYRDPNGKASAYRVGPLARVNCADTISTPLAAEELEQFKARCGNPSNFVVMNHYARLIEMLYCAERAVEILDDDEVMSDDTLTPITATPQNAVAHVEAPRGLLIHDYEVDKNGLMTACNLMVATQHNISSINAGIKAAAAKFLDKPDNELLNGIEFSIRCWDPCLSCATHQVGRMPLDVTISRAGETVRRVRR